jgi:hypothetical protein
LKIHLFDLFCTFDHLLNIFFFRYLFGDIFRRSCVFFEDSFATSNFL